MNDLESNDHRLSKCRCLYEIKLSNIFSKNRNPGDSCGLCLSMGIALAVFIRYEWCALVLLL